MTAAAAVAAPVRSLEIPLAKLVDAPWNARKSFPQASIDELAASVRQHGILQPLTVRPLTGSGDRFEVVAGARRMRAAKAAGLALAPCQVRNLDDAQAREIGLVDNLQREDLSPIEEAEGYQSLFQAAGDAGAPLTPTQLAAKVGKPEGYVRLRLRLLTAIDGVREALRSGKMPLGHALEIARLEPTDQKAALECLKGWNGEMPLSRLRSWIANDILLDLSKAPFSTKDAELVKGAGSCVDCPKRTGNNQLLFSDVREKDRCTDSACYQRKVARHIDVTVEQLAKKDRKVVRLSQAYQRDKSVPKEALTSGQYNKHIDAKSCDNLALGVMIDGWEVGKVYRVCLSKSCEVHGGGFYAASPRDVARMAAKRAAAKREKDCRMRMFRAALEKAQAVGTVGDDQLRQLAAYAIDRGDNYGTTVLMKELDWPKSFIQYQGRPKLIEKLKSVKPAVAVALGLLASVSGLLSVNEYSAEKPQALESVCVALGVNVGAIRKAVAQESAAKAAKKKAQKPAEKKPAAKKPAKKAAKKGGRK